MRYIVANTSASHSECTDVFGYVSKFEYKSFESFADFHVSVYYFVSVGPSYVLGIEQYLFINSGEIRKGKHLEMLIDYIDLLTLYLQTIIFQIPSVRTYFNIPKHDPQPMPVQKAKFMDNAKGGIFILIWSNFENKKHNFVEFVCWYSLGEFEIGEWDGRS